MSIHPLLSGSQLLDTSLLLIAGISLVLEGNRGFQLHKWVRPPHALLLQPMARGPCAQDSTGQCQKQMSWSQETGLYSERLA